MNRVFVLLTVLAATSAQAATHRVPSEYATINAALDASVSGDSVLVAPGTYTDYEVRPGAFGIPMSSCAWMKGGVTLISESGPEVTTIELVAGISPLRMIYVWQLTEEVWVEGFTVTSSLSPVLGAMVRDSVGATFVNCIFRDIGTGSNIDGALVFHPGDLTVIGCRFENLIASQGAAIIGNTGDLWVEDSHFENCQNGAISHGGSLVALPTTVVRNSVFVNNFQDNGSGGAIGVFNSASVEVSDCVFVGNVSTGSAGAVRIGLTNAGGNAYVRDNVFWQNHAGGGGSGGGFRVGANVIEATGNTFHACTQLALWGGGAAALEGGTVTFANNVVSECSGAGVVSLGSGTMESTCNIFSGNVDGDYSGHVPSPTDYNVDPQFCDPLAGDFSVAASSPCLPQNNQAACTTRIGARDAGCPSLGTTVVALTANTSGPLVIGDGVEKSATALFNWPSGSSRTISAAAFQNHIPGKQYFFASWSDGGSISHAITVPSTFTEIMATFDIEHYLTIVGIGAGAVPASEWVPAGEPRSLLAVPDTAWALSSWTGSGDGSYSGIVNPALVTMNGPITQTATFIPTHFELTMAADPGGSVTPPTGLQPVDAVIPIEATPDTGYVFSGWTGTGNGSYTGPLNPKTVTMNEAIAETAHFDPLLTMVAESGGSVSPGNGPYPPGTPIEIEAIPDRRYAFRSWTGAGNGSYTGTDPTPTVTMLGPITQTAAFDKIAYEVTLSLSDTDPYVHTGAPVPLGNVYLWLACGTAGGISTLEADVVSSMGAFFFSPAAGVLNAGGSQHLSLATSNCVTGPALLGQFTMFPPGEGSLCLTGTSVSNCALNPADVFAWPEDLKVTGVQTDGGIPCSYGRGCDETVPGGDTPVATPTVLPVRYSNELIGTFPNPFTEATSIRFSLERPSRVTLSVFDVTGRRIQELVDGVQSAGAHEVAWDGRDGSGRRASSGIFFVRMEAGEYSQVERLVLLR